MAHPSKGDKDPLPKDALISNEILHVTEKKTVLREYNVYLLSRIGDLEYYKELFDLFRRSDEHDSFSIYLNNFGGRVHTGIDIINAVRATKSTVRTVISGPLYSMAPLIALQGDEVVLEENTFMMFHDYSSMQGGKGSEIEASVKHYRSFFRDCFSQWTKGFLSRKEQDDVISGKDLYLNYAECKDRLKKMGKLG